jgi:hypothetical protein
MPGDRRVSAARRSELASTTATGTLLPLPNGQLMLDLFRGYAFCFRAPPHVCERPFQLALSHARCRREQLDRLFDIGLGRGVRDKFEECFVTGAFAGIAEALGNRSIQTQGDLYGVSISAPLTE